MRIGRKLKKVEQAIDQEAEAEGSPLLLSTGSTLLNLACTGQWHGGFMPGKYFFIVGDSASGKTFLSMTCFAEACINPAFDRHRLIYDNVEDGCLLDVERLFGRKVAARIESPARDQHSRTVQEFYYHLDDAIERGDPFIYVLDSMDSLTSESELAKFGQQKAAFRKGREVPGSYGDGKARVNSEGLRKALIGLKSTGSILLIISQTRDNIGFGFEKRTRSGGHALRFYATVEIWSRVMKRLKRDVKGKTRNIGVRVGLTTKKNRITGKLADVEVDIYPSYGIDDVGSCVDYLIAEGWWQKRKGTVVAKDFNIECTRDKLIATIEEKGLVDDLRATVGQCWQEIDAAAAVERRPRYETVDTD